VDNELEKKLQQAFDRFERTGEHTQSKKLEWWQSKKPESEWEYDAYFDQPEPGLVQQERITYKRREDGKIERETIVRRFYGNNDYQDSTTTEII
jgi:hypothetical protein